MITANVPQLSSTAANFVEALEAADFKVSLEYENEVGVLMNSKFGIWAWWTISVIDGSLNFKQVYSQTNGHADKSWSKRFEMEQRIQKATGFNIADANQAAFEKWDAAHKNFQKNSDIKVDNSNNLPTLAIQNNTVMTTLNVPQAEAAVEVKQPEPLTIEEIKSLPKKAQKAIMNVLNQQCPSEEAMENEEEFEAIGKIQAILTLYTAGVPKKFIVRLGFNKSTTYRQCNDFDKLKKAPATQYYGFEVFEGRVQRVMKAKKLTREAAVEHIMNKDLED